MKTNTLVWSYDSVADLIAATQRAPIVPENKNSFSGIGGNGRPSSRGWMCSDRPDVRDPETALRALAEPLFPQGAARVERLAREIQAPAPVSIRRRMRRGDHGDELCMSRVWQGDLDNAWTRAQRVHTINASRVLISVYCGASAYVDSETIAWRGVAAVALADALEAAGYTVAIRVIERSTLINRNGEKIDVNVTIKPEGTPLDVHRVANVIASPMFFRGVILAHEIVYSPTKISPGVSYPDAARATDEPMPGFDFTCLVSTDVSNAGAASVWVGEQVKKLDVLNGEEAA